MMIPIIYINPNGSGIGGKAIVPPLVVFHLRVGDSSSRRHDSPGPTQTKKKPVGGDSTSSTGSTESDGVAAPHDTTKATPKIQTLEEAWACLLAAQLIELEDSMVPDTLASSLVQISLFPGLSQEARDTTCSVVLLLAQMELSANTDTVAERLMGQMLDKLTETVKAITQAAITEVNSASSVLMESSMQIAATTVSYHDVLKNTAASPAAGAATLDARVRAREGVKARQVLIDVSALNQPLHQAASNQQLVSLANDTLHGMEDPPPHRFMCKLDNL